MEAAENAKAAGVAAKSAEQTGKYADKELRTLSIVINNLKAKVKAKVKREQGVQSHQELLRKLIQERKEYKEAPH